MGAVNNTCNKRKEKNALLEYTLQEMEDCTHGDSNQLDVPLSFKIMYPHIRFHLKKLSKGGGNWRNLDFNEGGDMMVEDEQKFHKRHLGGKVCINACVCVCRVSYRILSLRKGETPKFSGRFNDNFH